MEKITISKKEYDLLLTIKANAFLLSATKNNEYREIVKSLYHDHTDLLIRELEETNNRINEIRKKYEVRHQSS